MRVLWEQVPHTGNCCLPDLPVGACSPEAMDGQNGRSLAMKRNARDKAREATGHHEKELLHSRLITYVDALQTF